MIRIWGRPTSICTQRVLWGLVEAGQPFELTLASATMGPKGHVSKGGPAFGIVNTPEYLAMNPNATVPTLQEGDTVLWDSNAILLYLAVRHAPGPLYGNEPVTLAKASQWLSWTNEYLEPPLHTLVMELVRLAPQQRSAEELELGRQAMMKPLGILERLLERQHFVAGGTLTLGDIPTGAAVRRWLLFDLERPAMPAIDAWQARLAQREGFKRHVAPREYHLSG